MITGEFEYLPVHGFQGHDRFSFVVEDGELQSPPAKVELEVFPPNDSDRNGIPDYWERIHDIKNANDDRDLDGLTNLDEYRANTDPRDSQSFVEVVEIQPEQNGFFRIGWRAIAGTRHRVQYSDNYLESFQDIERTVGEEMAPGFLGETTHQSFTDDFQHPGGAPTNGNRFYRVRIINSTDTPPDSETRRRG